MPLKRSFDGFISNNSEPHAYGLQTKLPSFSFHVFPPDLVAVMIHDISCSPESKL